MTLARERIEHLHAELARQMIVANARMAHRGIGWTGTRAQMARARGDAHHRLQHVHHIVIGEAEIAVSPLLHARDQPAAFQLGQMRTGGLHGNARLVGKLGCGQRLSGQQRGQHVGARGIARKGGNGCDGRAFLHGSMVVEAFTPAQALICLHNSMEIEL
jgi:hypothetical protein